jgi:membrane-bound metal-dependent hydrolase YbcI (DUF457 family)
MPTPLAHGLMGAAIIAVTKRKQDGWFHWRGYLIGFALAAAPDLDCLFHWLPFAPFAGRGWHHDFTHSLGFALLSGWLCAVTLHRSIDHTRQMFVYAAAMATHPLLDCMFTLSEGVELLWPFRHERLRIGATPPVAYVWHHHSLLGKLVDLAQIALVEFAIFGSLFLLAWWVGQMAWRKPPTTWSNSQQRG